MLESRVAYTRELDEPHIAVREILEQLDVATLPKHSIGIIACEREFIDNGIVQAVCTGLPFETVGCTTTLSGVNGAADPLQFSIMVLTGDDVTFSLGLSQPFGDTHERCINDLHRDTLSRLSGDPVMAMVFAPMLFDACIDDERMAGLFAEALGDVPAFGTLACNYTNGEYIDNGMLYNGRYYDDRAAMILLSGAVKPRFTLACIPENRILKQKAIITEARGNLLIEVNGKPVLDYLDSLGLILDGQFIGAHAYPFIMDKGNGEEPSIRTIYGVTPEGYLKCGREMTVGASLSIGAQDIAAVKSTAQEVLAQTINTSHANAVLFFSCHSRSVTLALEERLELDLVDAALRERTPYLFAYSGGEICPFITRDGRYENYFHSDTIVACII